MIKKFFTFIAAAVLLLASGLSAAAEEGKQADEISYDLDRGNYSYSGDWSYTVLDDMTAAISGYFGGDTAVTVPSTVDGYTVTAIGGGWYEQDGKPVLYGNIHDVEYAEDGSISHSSVYSPFSENTSIVSVTLPSSVKYIGAMTFKGCSSLSHVQIGGGTALIGSSCFEDCTSLTSLDIPESVTLCDQLMCSGCTSLLKIEIPQGAQVGISAFEDCSALYSAVLPDSCTQLPASLFKNCSSLKDITFGNSLESVGDSAFYGCTALEAVTLPDSVKTIYNNAFFGCSSLSQVYVGENLDALGNTAFAGCALKTLTLPDSLHGIGKNAFGTDVNGTPLTDFTLDCPPYSAAYDYAQKNGIACTASAVTAPDGSSSEYQAGIFGKKLSPKTALYILGFAAAAIIAVIVLMIVNHRSGGEDYETAPQQDSADDDSSDDDSSDDTDDDNSDNEYDEDTEEETEDTEDTEEV